MQLIADSQAWKSVLDEAQETDQDTMVLGNNIARQANAIAASAKRSFVLKSKWIFPHICLYKSYLRLYACEPKPIYIIEIV